MAVSKISLPADFGIENLDCPVHGNIEIKLQEDRKMRANSMILSLHSPVFQNMFFNLGRPSVDLDDFRADVVGQFLAGLYDGKVEVNRDNFREMYKMATVFKIEWLRLRCEHFLCKMINDLLVEYNMRYTIGGDPLVDTLGRMLWIFEEAIFSLKTSKSSELLNITADLFIKKISSQGIIRFIQFYLSDFSNLSKEKLDIAIKITGENVVVLLQTLRDNICNISETGLTNSCKFLLNNMDLVKCRQQEPELYEEIFDILLENMDKLSGSDAKMVAQLNRQTLKSLLVCSASNKETVLNSETNPETSYEHIINLFHGSLENTNVNFMQQMGIHLNNRKTVSERGQDICAWIDFISQMKEVKNMYMVFEALFYRSEYVSIAFDERCIERLVMLKNRRGFSRVNPQFLCDHLDKQAYGFGDMSAKACNLMLQSEELVSCHESRRTVSEHMVPDNEFFSYKFFHTFRFPHHQNEIVDCGDSYCTFKLATTLETSQNLMDFNLYLTRNTSERHTELLSADKVHLVAEMHDSPHSIQTCYLSWTEKPLFLSSGTGNGKEWIQWGKLFCNNSRDSTTSKYIKLVAYVDQFVPDI